MKTDKDKYHSFPLLTGIFPSLGAEHASIKDGISRLFESWWLKEGQGREELMGNTLVYLLTKSTGPKATVCTCISGKKL